MGDLPRNFFRDGMDRIHGFYHGPPDDPARDLEFANWLVDEFPAVYEERTGHPMMDEQH
jgi:hypothetical protein